MTGDRTIRVLVVDDHPVVRDGLRGMLSGQPDLHVVGEAANGAEAVSAVAEYWPDVVLMDLRMPVLDGVGAIRQLSATHPAVRVLVLTTYDEDHEIVRAIEAGATGYLLKDTPREELYQAIRATARGVSLRWPRPSRSGCSASYVRPSRAPSVTGNGKSSASSPAA